MARRRRSILSPLGSISRNLRTLVTSLLGLGILGGVGYFTFFGGPSVNLSPDSLTESLDIVVFGESLEPAELQAQPTNNDIDRTIVDSNPNVRGPTVQSKSLTHITVGTFNIQRFGDSELEDQSVMNTLVEIVQQFDVIAIQEITNKDGVVIPRFLEMVNKRSTGKYDYLLSSRQGQETGSANAYREQFGFIFDTSRVRIKQTEFFGFVVSKKKFGDKYDRLPTVLQFEVLNSLTATPFTFSLVNVHFVPDSRKKDLLRELTAISDVYNDVAKILPGEDDIIVLGDFNSSSGIINAALKPLNSERKMQTALTDQKTNLAKSKSYDNLVFDANHTKEFVSAKVLDFTSICEKFGAEPKDVSDHFPVIAAFEINETGPSASVAGLPTSTGFTR